MLVSALVSAPLQMTQNWFLWVTRHHKSLTWEAQPQTKTPTWWRPRHSWSQSMCDYNSWKRYRIWKSFRMYLMFEHQVCVDQSEQNLFPASARPARTTVIPFESRVTWLIVASLTLLVHWSRSYKESVPPSTHLGRVLDPRQVLVPFFHSLLRCDSNTEYDSYQT